MFKTLAAVLIAVSLPAAVAPSPAGQPPAHASDGPVYTAGALKLPADYREWIFLTSGLDMNYNDPAPAAGHSIFQNVFVNPSSYRAFLVTGAWPEKTTFILELRSAEAHVSIDRRGQSQATDVRAIEVHLKDSTLPGGWGFYEFGSDTTAAITPRPAACYTCHEAHGAVDTTFVQFYPTLLPLARAKGTLSPVYLKDTAFPSSAPGNK